MFGTSFGDVDVANASVNSNDTISSNTTHSLNDMLEYPKHVLEKVHVFFANDPKSVKRATILLIFVTILIFLYIFVQCCRIKKRNSKARKYGVLTSSVELDPFGSDSEAEDTTVFDVNRRR